MSGYTPDERLRLEQLRKLRRQWLKDQELSPREPVLKPKPLGPIQSFWARFLEPKSLWRLYTYKAYQKGSYLLMFGLVPMWVVHYCVKYHIARRPYGIVTQNPRLYPGDIIMETGEKIPEFPETHSHH